MSAYVELVLELQRGLETLGDKTIPEQAAALRKQYHDSKELQELYPHRTFARALNDVLGVTRATLKRKQDRQAILFNSTGNVEPTKP